MGKECSGQTESMAYNGYPVHIVVFGQGLYHEMQYLGNLVYICNQPYQLVVFVSKISPEQEFFGVTTGSGGQQYNSVNFYGL